MPLRIDSKSLKNKKKYPDAYIIYSILRLLQKYSWSTCPRFRCLKAQFTGSLANQYVDILYLLQYAGQHNDPSVATIRWYEDASNPFLLSSDHCTINIFLIILNFNMFTYIFGTPCQINKISDRGFVLPLSLFALCLAGLSFILVVYLL